MLTRGDEVDYVKSIGAYVCFGPERNLQKTQQNCWRQRWRLLTAGPGLPWMPRDPLLPGRPWETKKQWQREMGGGGD